MTDFVRPDVREGRATVAAMKTPRTIWIGMFVAALAAGCAKKAPAAQPATAKTGSAAGSADDPDAKGITADDAAAQAKFEEAQEKKAPPPTK